MAPWSNQNPRAIDDASTISMLQKEVMSLRHELQEARNRLVWFERNMFSEFQMESIDNGSLRKVMSTSDLEDEGGNRSG